MHEEELFMAVLRAEYQELVHHVGEMFDVDTGLRRLHDYMAENGFTPAYGSHCQVIFDEKYQTWQLVGGSAWNVLGSDDLWYPKEIKRMPYHWKDFE